LKLRSKFWHEIVAPEVEVGHGQVGSLGALRAKIAMRVIRTLRYTRTRLIGRRAARGQSLKQDHVLVYFFIIDLTDGPINRNS
jgi:hypothetical protein